MSWVQPVQVVTAAWDRAHVGNIVLETSAQLIHLQITPGHADDMHSIASLTWPLGHTCMCTDRVDLFTVANDHLDDANPGV